MQGSSELEKSRQRKSPENEIREAASREIVGTGSNIVLEVATLAYSWHCCPCLPCSISKLKKRLPWEKNEKGRLPINNGKSFEIIYAYSHILQCWTLCPGKKCKQFLPHIWFDQFQTINLCFYAWLKGNVFGGASEKVQTFFISKKCLSSNV